MRRLGIRIGLAAVSLAAIVMLSVLSRVAQTIERDRDDAYLAAQAAKIAVEQRDRISRAVWRLDTMLTPLIAQESTRPPETYRPFLIESPEVAADDPARQSRRPITRNGLTVGEGEAIPSPLLGWTSDYVRVHFQIDDDGVWSSPQVPAQDEPWRNWIASDEVERRRRLLDELRSSVSSTELFARLPTAQLAIRADKIYATNTSDYGGNLDAARVGDTSAYRQDSLMQMEQAGLNGAEGARGASDAGQEVRDWELRNRLFETFANESLRNQRIVLEYEQAQVGSEFVAEGVTRPVWNGDKLLLIRRVPGEGCELIQGCWLDWTKLRERLLADIVELLPEADLRPADGKVPLEPSMLLATLPVRLVVPEATPGIGNEAGVSSRPSAVRRVLTVAWVLMAAALIAGGVLIIQAESLAERRAQFVSSVTHELRTPLTTFRMYAEMLESGMVPPGESTRGYLSTLRIESERLEHLIENVLAYSRIEHGRTKRKPTTLRLGELLARIEPRLRGRADGAGFAWRLEVDSARCSSESGGDASDAESSGARENEDLLARVVSVDPIAYEQILFNLVDNACKYGRGENSSVTVRIVLDETSWTTEVSDRGPGLDAAVRRRLFRPFSKTDFEAATTAPGIGLGLALCRRLAQGMGGRLELADEPASGACFRLRLPMV